MCVLLLVPEQLQLPNDIHIVEREKKDREDKKKDI